MNIESINMWLFHMGMVIEDWLKAIFGDDGRRYDGDRQQL